MRIGIMATPYAQRRYRRWLSALWTLLAMTATAAAQQTALVETTLVIPQVDYEGAIYHKPGDPLPYIDLKKVGWDRTVPKEHPAVILRSPYLEVTVLPRMGRVYSMVYRPTGHETLWRNDIVRPGGANNPTGWWLWIGGIEYTLPYAEHGTTWALDWDWQILEDSPRRQALRMQVTEPLTGLTERIDLSLRPQSAALETDIRIHNPTADTVGFAHWVNPMWTPGGHNELTDSTEFIIPTQQILIEERWQKNMGPSPQPWPDNPLRFIRNWGKMGDLMADGIDAGFYGAYAHEQEEGVVRVFDPLKNPGVDMWTYGFHPTTIPMGSGAPNKGYAEIWGGTVKTFPHETAPLAPGASIGWTEWIYPFQKTGGLSWANPDLALHHRILPGPRLHVALCPSRPLAAGRLEVIVEGRTAAAVPFTAAPDRPFATTVPLDAMPPTDETLILVFDGDRPIGRSRR